MPKKYEKQLESI